MLSVLDSQSLGTRLSARPEVYLSILFLPPTVCELYPCTHARAHACTEIRLARDKWKVWLRETGSKLGQSNYMTSFAGMTI